MRGVSEGVDAGNCPGLEDGCGACVLEAWPPALQNYPTPGRSLLPLRASTMQKSCVYFPQTGAAQRVSAGGGSDEARVRGGWGRERETHRDRDVTATFPKRGDMAVGAAHAHCLKTLETTTITSLKPEPARTTWLKHSFADSASSLRTPKLPKSITGGQTSG